MNHRWTIVCKRSVTDATTNLISIFDVLEKFEFEIPSKVLKEAQKLKKIPAVPFEFEIVTFFTDIDKVKDCPINVKVSLIDPKKKQIAEVNNQIKEMDIIKISKNLRMRTEIKGFPVTVSGIYTFKVETKKKGDRDFALMGEVPLEVLINEK